VVLEEAVMVVLHQRLEIMPQQILAAVAVVLVVLALLMVELAALA
jgi:hypothetical protein